MNAHGGSYSIIIYYLWKTLDVAEVTHVMASLRLFYNNEASGLSEAHPDSFRSIMLELYDMNPKEQRIRLQRYTDGRAQASGVGI